VGLAVFHLLLEQIQFLVPLHLLAVVLLTQMVGQAVVKTLLEVASVLELQDRAITEELVTTMQAQ